LLSFFPHLVLNPFHVAAAQALDLAAGLEGAFYLGIIENAETVDHRYRPTGGFHHLGWVKIQVSLVSDRKNDRINSAQGLFQILLYPEVRHFFLAAEKSF
jgi:hypothetical protein